MSHENETSLPRTTGIRDNSDESWQNVTSEGEPIINKNKQLIQLLIRRSLVRVQVGESRNSRGYVQT
jgi:hypothetical protein